MCIRDRTKKIRILNVDQSKMKLGPTGATLNRIPPDAYGSNQVNDSETTTHGADVNFSAGMHVDDEVVYKVTKAIWENLGEIHEVAEWLKTTVIPEDSLKLIAGRLHPGAEKYYREIGMDIPAPMDFWVK